MNLADAKLPESFSGIVRLFPLPNLVLFPGVVQALHIFEPRYRKMMQDLLAADHLVTLCLYENPEQQMETEDAPPIHSTVCVAKVIAHKELDDGRFNLLVMGVKRARIVRELPVEQPYRMAEVDILDDKLPDGDADGSALRSKLIENCELLDLFEKLAHQLDLKKVIESNIEIGLLIDLICFSADLDCSQRLAILKLPDVGQRLQQLLTVLKSTADESPRQNFPPDFSNN